MIFKKLESGQISVSFVGENILYHILEIPTMVVFGVSCFNCDTSKLCIRNNPAWNKDDVEVVI